MNRHGKGLRTGRMYDYRGITYDNGTGQRGYSSWEDEYYIADTPQSLLLTCEFRERQLSCRQ